MLTFQTDKHAIHLIISIQKRLFWILIDKWTLSLETDIKSITTICVIQIHVTSKNLKNLGVSVGNCLLILSVLQLNSCSCICAIRWRYFGMLCNNFLANNIPSPKGLCYFCLVCNSFPAVLFVQWDGVILGCYATVFMLTTSLPQNGCVIFVCFANQFMQFICTIRWCYFGMLCKRIHSNKISLPKWLDYSYLLCNSVHSVSTK